MTATRLQISSRTRRGIFVYVTAVAFVLGFQLTGWNPIPNVAAALVILALLFILRHRCSNRDALKCSAATEPSEGGIPSS